MLLTLLRAREIRTDKHTRGVEDEQHLLPSVLDLMKKKSRSYPSYRTRHCPAVSQSARQETGNSQIGQLSPSASSPPPTSEAVETPEEARVAKRALRKRKQPPERDKETNENPPKRPRPGVTRRTLRKSRKTTLLMATKRRRRTQVTSRHINT